jgi:hypothetical protein
MKITGDKRGLPNLENTLRRDRLRRALRSWEKR